MTVNSLETLFEEMLKDIYYVEKKLVKTLPGMAKMAKASELREAIQSHLSETEGHVARLEKIFQALDKKPTAKKCAALDGLLEEANETTGEITDERTRDAAIIASAQAVEHYEIARYGTLACWAEEIGHTEVIDLLQQTLDEEKAADQKLTAIAEDDVNRKAA